MNTTQTIKAIPTKYNGILFRSRLEARWAVFFEAAGIKWEYEKEGYVLQSGECYLPDFLVQSPEFGPLFIEIKPDRAPDEQEISKCRQVSTKYKTLMIYGVPSVDSSGHINAPISLFCRGLKHDKTTSTLADWLDLGRDTFPLECFVNARFEHGQVPNTTRPAQFIKVSEEANSLRAVQGKALAAIDFIDYAEFERTRDEAPVWVPGLHTRFPASEQEGQEVGLWAQETG